jgi:hypothetical protein
MYPMVYSGHVLYPKLANVLWIYGMLKKSGCEWVAFSVTIINVATSIQTCYTHM